MDSLGCKLVMLYYHSTFEFWPGKRGGLKGGGGGGLLKQCTDFGSFHTTSSTVLYKYFLTIVSVMNEQ